jgi:hypothetical protein
MVEIASLRRSARGRKAAEVYYYEGELIDMIV